ncbi:hypothetical protein TVAG_466250 [Trichomonas vaginalis G3]|uniref:Uncharacterized protein n=1 Tax=Trichomonas vaginalis (strain ATCC PRA-98 / G3) TaxID=412133 RepID=A2G600_TRIV3|nr:hypothetical protein TVAGG3_0084030 [Trichomonas vaginalis G3]EAX87418.1 hypothetical protein TVAG_466250 [Trichomonas vaginalis G3]KAI5543469.1 hypothetical protein TVAGG3_0084030 [Trichomonas vaginalis G3]|eukprot:XP_001300348.1 hypothetical protein [Trichomonas vaginalis G3]
MSDDPSGATKKIKANATLKMESGVMTPILNEIIRKRLQKTIDRDDYDILRREDISPSLETIVYELNTYNYDKFSKFSEQFQQFLNCESNFKNSYSKLILQDIKNEYTSKLEYWKQLSELNLKTPAIEALENIKRILGASQEEINEYKEKFLEIKKQIQEMRNEIDSKQTDDQQINYKVVNY